MWKMPKKFNTCATCAVHDQKPRSCCIGMGGLKSEPHCLLLPYHFSYQIPPMAGGKSGNNCSQMARRIRISQECMVVCQVCRIFEVVLGCLSLRDLLTVASLGWDAIVTFTCIVNPLECFCEDPGKPSKVARCKTYIKTSQIAWLPVYDNELPCVSTGTSCLKNLWIFEIEPGCLWMS